METWKIALDIEESDFTFDMYQKLAQRTSKSKSRKELIENGLLGLIGETGECSDIYKKYLFQGHDFNRDKFKDELSDVMWYVAELCSGLDVNLSTVLEINDIDEFQSFQLEPIEGKISILEYLLRLNSELGSISYDDVVTHMVDKNKYNPSERIYRAIERVIFIITVLSVSIGYDLKEILEHNIEKLYKRFPDGFSSERSINRD